MATINDLLSGFTPGSGAGGGILAKPGEGIQTNAPRIMTAPSAEMRVPGFGTGIEDILGQDVGEEVGGQQQGTLGDRLGGMASAGFADPTLGNIARAIGLGLSIASPMSPFGLAEGAILSQTGLPGYASPIMGMLAQSLGLPGPISLADFKGWGAFPPDLVAQLQTATPAQIPGILAQMQAYAAAHGSNAPGGGLEGALSGEAVQQRAMDRINQLNQQIGQGFFGSSFGGAAGGTSAGGGAQPGAPGSEGASARSGGVF